MRGNEIRNIVFDSKSKGNQMYSAPRQKTTYPTNVPQNLAYTAHITYAPCGMHASLKQEKGGDVLLQ